MRVCVCVGKMNKVAFSVCTRLSPFPRRSCLNGDQILQKRKKYLKIRMRNLCVGACVNAPKIGTWISFSAYVERRSRY